MQAGLWGQPHRDRVDPGSLGSGLAPLSGSLSAVHCVGLHCLASSAVSWWWAAFGLSQWSPGPVRNDSSWLFATVCGTDADVLRKEIPWDSRGPWTSWGRLWSASPWTPPPPHTPPNPLLRWGCPGRWWWSWWLCGCGGDTAWTLTLLSPASPCPPLLKQFLSLSHCRPLLVLLWSHSWNFCSAWVGAWFPPWPPSSTVSCAVEVGQIPHGSALPCGSWARAKVVTSLLPVATSNWETCPGSHSRKTRDTMRFWSLILPLCYMVWLFLTVLWWVLYSFYIKNHIIYKKW